MAWKIKVIAPFASQDYCYVTKIKRDGKTCSACSHFEDGKTYQNEKSFQKYLDYLDSKKIKYELVDASKFFNEKPMWAKGLSELTLTVLYRAGLGSPCVLKEYLGRDYNFYSISDFDDNCWRELKKWDEDRHGEKANKAKQNLAELFNGK